FAVRARSGRRGARRVVGSGGNRAFAARGRVDQPPARHDGLPCRGSRTAQFDAAGNERPVAGHGAHGPSRPVQSWAPDLGAVVARRSRSAVHARPLMAGAPMREAFARRGAVLLMGPTGAGKSDLAVRLAREFPLEIVSVDSALVYRGMDIGTAKPGLDSRRTVPHHLIDIRDPA